jgi:hypothetical protein
MEGQAIQSSGDGSQDNSIVVIILSAIGIYLLFRKSKSKEESKSSSEVIDSYSKFRDTAMGKSIDDQISDEGIDLSVSQILLLDKCLQNMSNEEMQVLIKASKFTQKVDIKKALSENEWKVFVPLRKKILTCIDETINR